MRTAPLQQKDSPPYLAAGLVALLLFSLSLVPPNAAAESVPEIETAAARLDAIPDELARPRLDAWQELLARVRVLAQGPSPDLALDLVNRFFNTRIRFGEDIAVWGVSEYWATPLETVRQGRGDCEDIAIAKYFTLLSAGVAPARLKLHYVTLLTGAPGGPGHVALTYDHRPDSRVVLDNLSNTITPLNERNDIRSVLEFDVGSVRFLGGKPIAVESWKRWAAVLGRSAQQGMPFGLQPVSYLTRTSAP